MSPSASWGQWGNYTDPETGLLCLGQRYYDPGTGRFLNRDPIGYAGGINLYGYAGDNPINDVVTCHLKRHQFWPFKMAPPSVFLSVL
jgi:RHS repeat-associated protein